MRFFVVALIMLLSATAFGDALDQASQALLTDRSYPVRVQAAMVLGKLKDRRGVTPLIAALRDKEAAVRVVAAAALGKLGDAAALAALRALLNDPEVPVRMSATKAISAIENPEPGGGILGPAPGARFALEVSPTACNTSAADSGRYTHRELSTQLGRLRGVSLVPGPGLTRFFVDTKIARLTAGPPDGRGRVQVECELSVIVATSPERAIKMMATVGGTLDERNDPKGLAEAKNFCLGDAAKQAAEKVQTYLQGVR